MLEFFEKPFSLLLRLFILGVVFSFSAMFIIGIMELFKVGEFIGSEITSYLVFALSLVATYFLVKFGKPYFQKYWK